MNAKQTLFDQPLDTRFSPYPVLRVRASEVCSRERTNIIEIQPEVRSCPLPVPVVSGKPAGQQATNEREGTEGEQQINDLQRNGATFESHVILRAGKVGSFVIVECTALGVDADAVVDVPSASRPALLQPLVVAW